MVYPLNEIEPQPTFQTATIKRHISHCVAMWTTSDVIRQDYPINRKIVVMNSKFMYGSLFLPLDVFHFGVPPLLLQSLWNFLFTNLSKYHSGMTDTSGNNSLKVLSIPSRRFRKSTEIFVCFHYWKLSVILETLETRSNWRCIEPEDGWFMLWKIHTCFVEIVLNVNGLNLRPVLNLLSSV